MPSRIIREGEIRDIPYLVRGKNGGLNRDKTVSDPTPKGHETHRKFTEKFAKKINVDSPKVHQEQSKEYGSVKCNNQEWCLLNEMENGKRGQ